MDWYCEQIVDSVISSLAMMGGDCNLPYQSHFLNHTYINNSDCSNMTATEVAAITGSAVTAVLVYRFWAEMRTVCRKRSARSQHLRLECTGGYFECGTGAFEQTE